MEGNNDDLSSLIKQSFEGNPDMKIMTPQETPGLENMMHDYGKEGELTTKSEKPAETQVENKAEATPPTTEKVDSSLTTESTETKTEAPTSSKSFEEYLAEKSEGKFKSWDEIAEKINKPEVKFADERVAKINEYIEQGGTYEDWTSTQAIDFNDLTPAELIAYQMQLNDPDITQEEIELELKMKYGFDKWKDNLEDYEDGKEPDDVKIMKLRFERESNKAKKELLEYQKKWSVPQNKKTDEQLKLEQAAKVQAQEKWDGVVEDTMKTVGKLPLKLSDKETFDYVLNQDEQKEVNSILKQLYTNSNAMFMEFADKNSPVGLNVKSIAEMVAKAKYFDKAIAAAAEQARSAGKHDVVKEIKNADMTPGGKSTTQSTGYTVDEKVAMSILNG